MKTIVLPSITAAAAVWLAGPAPAKAQPLLEVPAAIVATGADVATGIVGDVTYPYDYDDAYAYGAPVMQCGLGWGCQPYPGDAAYTLYPGDVEYPAYPAYPGYGAYVVEYPAFSGYRAEYPAHAAYLRVVHDRGYRVSHPRTAYRAEYRGKTRTVTHHAILR